MTRVDLLYLACNRLAFTQETFTALLANTDWHLVHELFVYDDGSVDGTCEWLKASSARALTRVRFVHTRFGSPVSAMVHFIESASAPILAKTDNDAMLPPGWLRQSLDVLDRHAKLTLLGIEAIYPHVDDPDLPRDYTPAQFISGLGLYRRSAFAHSRPQAFNKYYGLEEWQMAQGPALTRGWITPAIPVFLLDRLPFQPWAGLSEEYERRGWQRSWADYAHDCTLWHWHWPKAAAKEQTHTSERQAGSKCKAVDGDGSNSALVQADGGVHTELPAGLRLNLGCCESALEGYINRDIFPGPDGEAVDFEQPWPWADDSVAFVRAWDFVEHLPHKAFTMNEVWRVLVPGGQVEITVPTTEGSGAFQDPTHVSFWNRRSFLYYEAGNPYRERFALHYGIRAKFRVVREETVPTIDGPRLTIVLEAVKP